MCNMWGVTCGGDSAWFVNYYGPDDVYAVMRSRCNLVFCN